MKKFKVLSLLSALSAGAVFCSGGAFALTKEVLDEATSFVVPRAVKNALLPYFDAFEIHGIKLLADIGCDVVGMIAKERGVRFVKIDARDLSSIEDFNSILGKGENGVESKPVKTVVCLSNMSCKCEPDFRRILKVFKGRDNVFLYVGTPAMCGEKKCRDCVNMSIDLFEFAKAERLMYFRDLPKLYFRDVEEIIRAKVESWKSLSKSGKLDVGIDLIDEDVRILSSLFSRFVDANDFRSLIERAFVIAKMRGENSKLCLSDFIKVIMDFTMCHSSDVEIPDEDGINIAIHEMGHAVVGHLVGISPAVVVSRDNIDGVTYLLNNKRAKIEGQALNYDDIIAYCKMIIAGKLAGKIVYGEDSAGAGDDISKVRDLIIEAAKISDPIASVKDPFAVAEGIYNKIVSETEKLILDNSELIRRLAKRLVACEKVNGLKVMRGSRFLKEFEEINKQLDKELNFKSRLVDMMEKDGLTDGFISYVSEYKASKPESAQVAAKKEEKAAISSFEDKYEKEWPKWQR